MKKSYLLLAPAPLIFALFLSGRETEKQGSTSPRTEEIAMCSSPAGVVRAGTDGKFIPALNGLGNVNCTISTKSDSAQFYFNQGLSFYYGYHFTESLASFKEASRFDPACAMTYWGQALSMGPFYNTYVYKMKKEVPGVVNEMIKNSSAVTERERGMIDALQKRYSNDLTNADRKQLDRNYASALAELEKKFPADDDIRALYIDAVMLEHKWDFWDQKGVARPWTADLVAQCENSLKQANHPAILHYYIHLTEASRQPGKALTAAENLKDQVPGIGHMVHMSSHMYQRNGLYVKGVNINDDANAVNNKVDSEAPALKLGKDRSPHFFAVQSYCAMTAGMYGKGKSIYQRARDRQVALSDDLQKDVYGQFVYMIPVIANVRLGKWEEILKAPDADATWKYAVVLDNFAKGIAHVRKNDLKSAQQALTNIGIAMKDSALSVRLMPFNSPLQSCRIASSLLEAEILFAGGKSTESIVAFQRAIEEEDNMVYREPQDWLIPARQFLGACLLKMKNPKEAEKIYAEDLMEHPGNGWSLVGMYNSLNAQKNMKAAEQYKTKYKKAFESADVEILASVF